MRTVLPPGGVEYGRIPGLFDGEPDLNTEASKGIVMAKAKFRPLHDRVGSSDAALFHKFIFHKLML